MTPIFYRPAKIRAMAFLGLLLLALAILGGMIWRNLHHFETVSDMNNILKSLHRFYKLTPLSKRFAKKNFYLGSQTGKRFSPAPLEIFTASGWLRLMR